MFWSYRSFLNFSANGWIYSLLITMREKIECIIFDCDGTLVDSELLCNLALEIKLKDYGVETSAQIMMGKYRGGKLADILDSIQKEYNIILDDNFVKEYRSLTESLFEKELKPCKGVVNALETLNIPICVASSGPLKKIRQALSITDIEKYFRNNIYSSYEIKSWKPDPEIFLHAAKSMGFKPYECLVVEDSAKGLEAGLAAGMKTVLFEPIKTDVVTIRTVNYTIDNMEKLIRIIEEHNTL